MDFRQLEVLRAIAQNGNFTSAADNLGTVQSNISAQLKSLEDELHTTLVVRSRTGARLTEQGQVVVDRAKRIKTEIDSMLVDLSMLEDLQRGHASIGVIGTASRWIVPSLVQEMRSTSPGVTLHITEAPSERLLADVISHDLSVAVITEPVNDTRVETTTLCNEELVGIAPKDFGLSARKKTFEEIAKYPHVLTPITNPLRTWIDDAAKAQGVTLAVPINCEGIRLIPRLVNSGVGCSILPLTALPDDMSNMVKYSITDLPYRHLALISAKDAVLSMAERVVSDVIIRLSK
jgi:DNA-binding transcriptional LysR family regulator